MKALTFILSLVIASVALAEDPDELRKLRIALEKAKAAELEKLNKIYFKKLKELKKKFIEANKHEAVLAVDTEIETLLEAGNKAEAEEDPANTDAAAAQLKIRKDVEEKIRDIYVKKYPNDFSMQKTLIESQLEAFDYLSGWSDEKGIPQGIFTKIREIYASKYPGEYSMQQTLVENQFEAYTFMESYNSAEGVPNSTFLRIKDKYQQKYPDDYSMQKTLIENQVESYLDLRE
jgi:uncharacterized protein YbgA (DUF1722 family)